RWQDPDFSIGLILIADSKNGEPRHVPMDSTVLSLFKTYPRHPTSDFVFAKSNGNRFMEVRGGFRSACVRAGIADLRFHDLRHSYASNWVMSGGGLYPLQRLLGHKSIAMTQRYAHLSPEFKRAAVNRMDIIWKVGVTPAIGAAQAFPTDLRSQPGHKQSLPTPQFIGD